jgi:hypothetical protein
MKNEENYLNLASNMQISDSELTQQLNSHQQNQQQTIHCQQIFWLCLQNNWFQLQKNFMKLLNYVII